MYCTAVQIENYNSLQQKELGEGRTQQRGEKERKGCNKNTGGKGKDYVR